MSCVGIYLSAMLGVPKDHLVSMWYKIDDWCRVFLSVTVGVVPCGKVYRKTKLKWQLTAACLWQSSVSSAVGCVYFHQCTLYIVLLYTLMKVHGAGGVGSGWLPETNNSQLSLQFSFPIVLGLLGRFYIWQKQDHLFIGDVTKLNEGIGFYFRW